MKIQNINPDSVPKKTLNNGDRIPVIGLGTFGSDNHLNMDFQRKILYL